MVENYIKKKKTFFKIGRYRIEFIDRVDEIKKLMEWIDTGAPFIYFIYGPEGCGKTALLSHFLNIIGDDIIPIYINAIERSNPESALISPNILKIKNIIKDIVGESGGFIGPALAHGVITVIDKVSSIVRLKDKCLAIMIDDVVQSIGLGKIEGYIKWLYESMPKISEKYGLKSITMIATTSEGISRWLVERHTYSITYLIWNLLKKDYIKLAEQLDPINKNIIEETWRLTGGNPRTLIQIALAYKWNIEKWLKGIEERLNETIIKIRSLKLEKELQKIIENIDIIYLKPDKNIFKLREILEKENLIIYKYKTTLRETRIKENKEIGIGKYYAWQIPAYMKILERKYNSSKSE